jgi:hypothetical protein
MRGRFIKVPGIRMVAQTPAATVSTAPLIDVGIEALTYSR